MNTVDKKFDQIKNEAYNAGYELKVNPDTLKVTLTSIDKELMPEIEVITIRHQDARYLADYYTFDSVITFPKIDTRKFLYDDDLTYYIDKWANVVDFVSILKSFTYREDEEE